MELCGIAHSQCGIVKSCIALAFLVRVKEKYKLQQTFSVNPIYLRHDNSGATDFMVHTHPIAALCHTLLLPHF